MFRAKVTGLKSIDRAIGQIEPRLMKKVLRQALRSAMKPVAEQVQANAPVGETGGLKSGITLRAGKRTRKGRISVVVRAFTPQAVAKEYGNVRVAAAPFMRPALDEVGPGARDQFERDALRGIARVVDELRPQ